MQIDYLKMHGAGNRILVVDERLTNRPPPTPEKLRALADDVSGPGFDQLMWVLPARDSDAAASYRVFNADGTEVEQCGNGVRCVARMLARTSGEETFLLEGPAGPVEARMDGGRITVSMGRPEFEPARIPFIAEKAELRYKIDVNDEKLEISALSMGNPHCVLDVADVSRAPVATLGPSLEHHPRFPARANVGFMQVVDPGHIRLRVHERGVGETLACGTGACAAVVSGLRRCLLDGDVTVDLPGGQLMVSWRRPAEPVWLSGNAELICEGTIDL